ncbi:cell division cycle-associated protein 7-like isoform X2 [Dunckerocampus dactyliophorus]|uniref:cell division cycle-associated protein 7-like isoform X2 n=1 Tax=Dunckerocampus dactyliophorus TaxID=161453 RepID=UPI00240586D4|nr:cell division cycle-associated protein 7-like isoform X2 [Dunckerocampus dactyliophorus]
MFWFPFIIGREKLLRCIHSRRSWLKFLRRTLRTMKRFMVLNTDMQGEDQDNASTQQKSTSKAFRLRVAFRSVPLVPKATDDDDDDDEEDETRGSDEAEDVSDSFMAKREQNIRANKAMLAQLMADLQKMPGGVGFLKKQEGKQPKERNSRTPRSGKEPRKNPERAARRQTRSMGRCEELPGPQEADMELSLEEELLEVRRAPQRRGTPRPSQSKPHIIRPVEEITDDELQLVADNMTEKVYNRVTGSTCHQCRQKTVDTKTCCRNEECRGIQGQFCGPCLRNRYGEDVRKALLEPEWHCPPCRGICNCSFCRQREGRCPTGILFPLAQYHGFLDVHSYLSSLRNKLKSDGVDVEM